MQDLNECGLDDKSIHECAVAVETKYGDADKVRCEVEACVHILRKETLGNWGRVT